MYRLHAQRRRRPLLADSSRPGSSGTTHDDFRLRFEDPDDGDEQRLQLRLVWSGGASTYETATPVHVPADGKSSQSVPTSR